MTLIALGSAKGAPGVTTTALALAAVWPPDRHVVVAEVDPDGGVLAARRGLGFEPGLVSLAAGLRRGSGDLAAHTQPLGDNVRALVAPSTAGQVRASIATAGDRLWDALAGAGDVLLDCGRMSAASPAIDLARRADELLLVSRTRLDEIALVRDRIDVLRNLGGDPRVVLIDDGPYHRDEITSALAAPIVAVFPLDRRAADDLNGTAMSARTARSRLLRSARALAGSLMPGTPSAADESAASDPATAP